MKPISIRVREGDFQRFKALAAQTGRPVAELIREAMARYLEERASRRVSPLSIQPHASGPLEAHWTRSDLYDEMGSNDFEVN